MSNYMGFVYSTWISTDRTRRTPLSEQEIITQTMILEKLDTQPARLSIGEVVGKSLQGVGRLFQADRAALKQSR